MRIHYWELSNYNSGRLIGKWFDLDNVSEDEHLEEIEAWMKELTEATGQLCEEWIVGDTEDVPKTFVNTYSLDQGFWAYKEALENSHLSEEAFNDGIELGIPPDKVEEAFVGEFDNDEDFGFALVGDQVEEKLGHELALYFDYKAYARDRLIDEYDENGGHYFRKDW